jgi:pyrroloquinoline-quinone synthase
MIKIDKVLSPAELEETLRQIGAERYHSLHPFHKLLHGGELNKGQVQAWVLNRYVYQQGIPQKDYAILSNCEDRDLRRIWRQRVDDHDGHGDDIGGIERWLKLCEALGLDRDYVKSMQGVHPASKHAVDTYINFCRRASLLIGIASCLTELFAPKIHKERIAGMLENYDFIDDSMVAYFRERLTQAPRDVDFALNYVKEHAKTVVQQQGVIDALYMKTGVLWAQLDALYLSYVAPKMIPPGCFDPEGNIGFKS